MAPRAEALGGGWKSLRAPWGGQSSRSDCRGRRRSHYGNGRAPRGSPPTNTNAVFDAQRCDRSSRIFSDSLHSACSGRVFTGRQHGLPVSQPADSSLTVRAMAAGVPSRGPRPEWPHPPSVPAQGSRALSGLARPSRPWSHAREAVWPVGRPVRGPRAPLLRRRWSGMRASLRHRSDASYRTRYTRTLPRGCTRGLSLEDAPIAFKRSIRKGGRSKVAALGPSTKRC